MILPTNEIGGDPLGNIAELPAATPPLPRKSSSESVAPSNESSSSSRIQEDKSKRYSSKSWTQFNSLGNRDPAARLSQPHGVPDASAAIWGRTIGPLQNNKKEVNE